MDCKATISTCRISPVMHPKTPHTYIQGVREISFLEGGTGRERERNLLPVICRLRAEPPTALPLSLSLTETLAPASTRSAYIVQIIYEATGIVVRRTLNSRPETLTLYLKVANIL